MSDLDVKIINLERFMEERVLEKDVPWVEINLAALKDTIGFLVSETHPADHAFIENPDFPGTCLKCTWVEKGVLVEDSGSNDDARSHLLSFPVFIEHLKEEAKERAAFVREIQNIVGDRVPILFIG